MKTTHILILTVALGIGITACKKNEPQPANTDSTATTTTAPTPAPVVDEFNKFKADAEARIKAIEDSIDAYDARIKGPKYTAAMKKEAARSREELAKLRAELAAQKDEASGSWKRTGEDITRSIDTIGTRVSRVFK
jgi:Skp family chaperone for outer membrane proteins